MFGPWSVLTFHFMLLHQFVRGIYPVIFIISNHPRIDTFIIACNLQSVEWSVNHLFQEEVAVLITPTSL
jgi:hypothetical protein